MGQPGVPVGLIRVRELICTSAKPEGRPFKSAPRYHADKSSKSTGGHGLAGHHLPHFLQQGTLIFLQQAVPQIIEALNLLADGLSLPVALIINLICLALAFFSIHYVEHRIELIYGA